MPSFKIKSSLWGRFFLILVWLVIVLANYVPGTRSLSWDVMDSSFNPGLNIWRSLFATWQEFQGLGLLGGHGYAAQLPHALIVWFLDLFLPQNALRYSFAFLLLLIGSLGCFEITKYIINQFSSKKKTISTTLIATLTSCIYLLHFGTVSTFYVHLEPFIVMYGLLPWTLWLLFKVLKKPSTKTFLMFFVVNFFLSVIGFIPPVFISYILIVSIILITTLLQELKWKSFQTCVVVGLLIAATNLYWFLPVSYFTVFNQSDYLDSKLNQLTTQEFIEKNHQYGQIENVALMKSFYFDSNDLNRFNSSEKINPILQPWIAHLKNPVVQIIYYSMFTAGCLGLVILTVWGFKQKKSIAGLGAAGLLIISLLATGTPGLNLLSWPLRKISFLNQAFRIPFTKLSMSATLFIALGIGVLFWSILVWLKQKFKTKSTKSALIITWLLALFALFYSSHLSFTGNFLYPGSRLNLPDEYQHGIEVLNSLPSSARTAVLPIATNTGWDSHWWNDQAGYTGSGFWWYGTNTPLLHRSFDVWSPYNETYYLQLSTAIYNNDLDHLKRTLDQYNVTHILVDKSITLLDKKSQLLNIDGINSLLEKTGTKQIWQEGDLSLYELSNANQNTIEIPSAFTTINTSSNRVRNDTYYESFGNYLEIGNQENTVSLPFSNLNQEKPSNIKVENEFISISSNVFASEGDNIVLPAFNNGDTVTFPTQVLYEDETIEFSFAQDAIIYLGTKQITLQKPENIIFDISQIDLEDHIYVDIFGQQTILTKNIPRTVSLTFVIGNENELVVFNQSAVEFKNSNKLVETKDIHNFPVGKSFSDQLLQIKTVVLSEDISQIQTQITNSLSTVVPLENINSTNCNQYHLGTVKSEYNDDGLLQLANEQASLCANYINSTLDQKQSYILSTSGENFEGRSLTFYLQNLYNDRPDLEILLPSGKFKNNYIIYPWKNQPLSGYTLHWQTRSFGSESKNLLSNITFTPLPLEQLLKLEIEKSADSNSLVQQSNSKVSIQNRIGTGFYSVLFTTNSKEVTNFTLNQSYNDGWIAFITSSNSFDIQNYKILPHSRYNGWANAWQVPGCENESDCEYQIVIFYWPQLLSTLGYGFLVIGLIALIVKSIPQSPRKLR